MKKGQTEEPQISVKIIEVKPEVHAEKCVVCNGFGTLKWGEKVCQACKGKGFIFVPNLLQDIQEP